MNAFNILSYGVIGLGFLLALLAYQLLRREQALKEPRLNILKAVYVFMVFSIVLCIIGFASELIRSRPSTPTLQGTATATIEPIEVKLISARPTETKVGSAARSREEIENLLSTEVRKRLSEKVFDDPVSRRLHGKVSFLIYNGSNGYANNVSIDDANFDPEDHESIIDVFRGTQFPEPIGDEEQKAHAEPSYWVNAEITVNPVNKQ